MAQLYRVRPLDKKSIYTIYDVYRLEPNGTTRGFVVRELYRWGQGFRDLDTPVYETEQAIWCDPNLGWGADLDDLISIDFDFDHTFTEEEKAEIESFWCDGDPADDWGRCGAAWLYDVSDWMVDDDSIEIIGPVQVDIVDAEEYNVVIQENVPLEKLSPKPANPNSAWPFEK